MCLCREWGRLGGGVAWRLQVFLASALGKPASQAADNVAEAREQPRQIHHAGL